VTRDILILEIAAEIEINEISISHKKAKQIAELILTERLEKYKVLREINPENGEYERDE